MDRADTLVVFAFLGVRRSEGTASQPLSRSVLHPLDVSGARRPVHVDVKRRHEHGHAPNVGGSFLPFWDGLETLLRRQAERVIQRFGEPVARQRVVFALSALQLVPGWASAYRSLPAQKHDMAVRR